MSINEAKVNGCLVLNDGEMEVPYTAWGHPEVRVNGQKVPSSRLWAMMAENLARGEKTPREQILAEGRRAEIYVQKPGRLLYWTEKPDPKDEWVSGDVYWHKDKVRGRPLVDEFGIVLARIVGPAEPDHAPQALRELHAAAAQIGLLPVAGGDGHYMYCQDPELVFEAFGTRNWQQLYKFLKRPGTSFVEVRL